MTKVRRSTIIDAPIDQVWQFLRDFNGHERWHPAVAESRIEEGREADRIGAVRRFKLKDGGELREQAHALARRELARVGRRHRGRTAVSAREITGPCHFPVNAQRTIVYEGTHYR